MQEKSDAVLLLEITSCARQLSEMRAQMAKLETQLISVADEVERQFLLRIMEGLDARGVALDLKIDGLQKEQRRRAGMRGVAIATCRAPWS